MFLFYLYLDFNKGNSQYVILKNDITFKNQVITEICQKLISKLQKDIKLTYTLTGELAVRMAQQQKETYLKANQMTESLLVII